MLGAPFILLSSALNRFTTLAKLIARLWASVSVARAAPSLGLILFPGSADDGAEGRYGIVCKIHARQVELDQSLARDREGRRKITLETRGRRMLQRSKQHPFEKY